MYRAASAGDASMSLRASYDAGCPDQAAEIDVDRLPRRRQRAVVMFVDMVGSTACFRQMMPEDVLVLLRQLMALLRECVLRHGGVVEKFLGDGLMAVFGLPGPDAADAANAAQCAVAILRCVEAWNEQRRLSGDRAIRVAIG